MNSNKKYDFYKNSIYYAIANAVLVLAGIIVVAVCGFNHQTSITFGSILLQSVLLSMISLLLIFVYIGLRYDFAKAFSIVLTSAHNLLLATAIIAIIRIPVTESIVMGYMILIGISTLYTLIQTEKIKDINLKKADYAEVIKNATKESYKPLLILSIIVIVLMVLTIFVGSSHIFSMARVFFVMMFVALYTSFTLALPTWCFFSSKIKKVKRTKVDKNVDNQKVVKAVSVEGEEVSTAEINE